MPQWEEVASDLHKTLKKELEKIRKAPQATREDLFCVHKECLEQVIGVHSAYKALLSRIKAEYEECINAMKEGQKELTNPSGQLVSALTQPVTLRYYQNRADDLAKKIFMIHMDNERLKVEQQLRRVPKKLCRRPVVPLIDDWSPRSTGSDEKENASGNTEEGLAVEQESRPPSEENSSYQVIPGLPIEEQTDIVFLKKTLERLLRMVMQLQREHKERFYPKKVKFRLLERLQEREEVRRQLYKKYQELREAFFIEKMRVTAENHRRQRHQELTDKFASVAFALKDTFAKLQESEDLCEAGSEADRDEDCDRMHSSESDVSDPGRDQEADNMLEHIGLFYESLQAARYEEAVMAASHSPKGILRIPETVETLKDIEDTTGKRGLLLSYWELLVPTVLAPYDKLQEWETIECVTCVLKNGRCDLLFHWIAQDKLKFSRKVGILITEFCCCVDRCNCGLYALSHLIFCKVNATTEVLWSLLMQGRYQGAVEHYRRSPFASKEVFICAIERCATRGMVTMLQKLEQPFSEVLSVEEVVATFLNMNKVEAALKTMQRGFDDGYRFQVSSLYPSSKHEFGRDLQSRWILLKEFCEQSGQPEVGLEIQAFLTVKAVIHRARMVFIVCETVRPQTIN